MYLYVVLLRRSRHFRGVGYQRYQRGYSILTNAICSLANGLCCLLIFDYVRYFGQLPWMLHVAGSRNIWHTKAVVLFLSLLSLFPAYGVRVDLYVRCFISAEPPPMVSMKNMPESLMQSCIKVRTYSSWRSSCSSMPVTIFPFAFASSTPVGLVDSTSFVFLARYEV